MSDDRSCHVRVRTVSAAVISRYRHSLSTTTELMVNIYYANYVLMTDALNNVLDD